MHQCTPPQLSPAEVWGFRSHIDKQKTWEKFVFYQLYTWRRESAACLPVSASFCGSGFFARSCCMACKPALNSLYLKKYATWSNSSRHFCTSISQSQVPRNSHWNEQTQLWPIWVQRHTDVGRRDLAWHSVQDQGVLLDLQDSAKNNHLFFKSTAHIPITTLSSNP